MERQHDDRGYEPCRGCLHFTSGFFKDETPGGQTYRHYTKRCALGHDLYPRTCGDFTEQRPAREKP